MHIMAPSHLLLMHKTILSMKRKKGEEKKRVRERKVKEGKDGRNLPIQTEKISIRAMLVRFVVGSCRIGDL